MKDSEVHPLFDPAITWLTPQQVDDLNMKKKMSDVSRRGHAPSSESIEQTLAILGG